MRAVIVAASLFLSATALDAHPGSAIVLDRQGNVYFVDTGSGIYEIDRQGQLTRIQGPAFHWMTIDLDHRFAAAQWPTFPDAEIRNAPGNPALLLSSDFPVAIGSDGAFYYTEQRPDRRAHVIRFTAKGGRSILATVPLPWLNGMAAGRDGSIYYTENDAVRRIDRRGRIATVASGIQVRQCGRIPGIGPESGVYLRGLDVAADGTVFVAASGCGAVLKISTDGKVSELLRIKSPWSPTSVAVGRDGIYVLEYLHTASDNRREWTPRIRKLTSDGHQTMIATIRR
jgi:streptogramin lyase